MQRAERGVRAFRCWGGRGHGLRGDAGQVQEKDARLLAYEVVQVRVVVGHDQAHGLTRLDGEYGWGEARIGGGDLNLFVHRRGRAADRSRGNPARLWRRGES